MHFKLLITLVEDDKTNAIMAAAREAGATGATVLSQGAFLDRRVFIRRSVSVSSMPSHPPAVARPLMPVQTVSWWVRVPGFWY